MPNKDKGATFGIICLLAVAIGSIWLVIALTDAQALNRQYERQIADLETFKMYDEAVKNWSDRKNITRGIDGVAFGDYFLVWTKGRNITHVLEICTHEYAHNNLGMKD